MYEKLCKTVSLFKHERKMQDFIDIIYDLRLRDISLLHRFRYITYNYTCKLWKGRKNLTTTFTSQLKVKILVCSS